MVKTCLICQKEFRTFVSWKDRKHCSRQCAGIANSKRLRGKKRSTFWMIGEKNSNWKGGRYVDGYGYVHLLQRSHPNADRKGYVKEHRLVMEKHLGRYLLKKEVVHHINSIKNDNRIENLILLSNNTLHMQQEWKAGNMQACTKTWFKKGQPNRQLLTNAA